MTDLLKSTESLGTPSRFSYNSISTIGQMTMVDEYEFDDYNCMTDLLGQV